MALYTTLTSAAQALNVHSRCIDVASNNLANLNNPAYSKQVAYVTTVGSVQTPDGAQSLGIQIGAIQHLRDDMLDTRIMDGKMDLASLKAQQFYYKQLELDLGESIDRTKDNGTTSMSPDAVSGASGLMASMSSMFNAFSEVASAPNEQTKRSQMLSKTAVLTNRFHAIDQRLDSLGDGINQRISNDVTSVTNILDQLATTNLQISTIEAVNPGSALDLRDLRQKALEDLAGYMDFEVAYTDDTVPQMILTAQASTGSSVTMLRGRDVAGTLTYDETAHTFAFSGTTLSLAGGSLHGSQQVLTTTLVSLSSSLDTLAANLVTEINAAYNPAQTDPTLNFFDATALTSGTITLQSGLTASNFRPGSSTNAGADDLVKAMADLKSTNISGLGNTTFGKYLSNTIASVGGTIAKTNSAYDDIQKSQNSYERQRDNYGGVSINEEVTNLMTAQMAFQANARVVNIISEMLKDLIGMVG